MLLSKNRIIRRRAVVGLLLAASLTLLTLSFRQGSTGVVGEIQRDAVSINTSASLAFTGALKFFAVINSFSGMPPSMRSR